MIRSKNEAEVMKAVQSEKEKISALEADKKELEFAVKSEQEKGKTRMLEAVQKANEEIRELETSLTNEKERNKILLEEKDKQIEFYKDLKTKMSTKMERLLSSTVRYSSSSSVPRLSGMHILKRTMMQRAEARVISFTVRMMRAGTR